MNRLFRPEMLEHRRRRLDGEVVITLSPFTRVLSWSIIAAAAALAMVAALTTYARKETAPGWIVPDTGLLRVSARTDGVVQDIAVKEGQRVKRGQLLARVRLSSDLEEGDAGVSMIEQLAIEGQALQTQTAVERKRLVAAHAGLVARRAALTRELDESRRQVMLLEEQQRLADRQVERGDELLARGLVSPMTLDARKAGALAVAGEVSRGRVAALSLTRQIEEVDEQLAGAPAEMTAAVARGAQAKAALSQRRFNAQASNVVVVRSPIDGEVLAIPISAGETIAAGRTVSVIAPVGAKLMAELYVPSRAAGFILPGQPVRLKYQAFPYQKFGTGGGVVEAVSKTILAPSELTSPGIKLDQPVFRVRVRIDKSKVMAYGGAIPLQPGMLLAADIVIDRRDLIHWLLDPLYASGRGA